MIILQTCQTIPFNYKTPHYVIYTRVYRINTTSRCRRSWCIQRGATLYTGPHITAKYVRLRQHTALIFILNICIYFSNILLLLYIEESLLVFFISIWVRCIWTWFDIYILQKKWRHTLYRRDDLNYCTCEHVRILTQSVSLFNLG